MSFVCVSLLEKHLLVKVKLVRKNVLAKLKNEATQELFKILSKCKVKCSVS